MLRVYSERITAGDVCMVYLHSDPVYTVCLVYSSGAYCGGTVGSVQGLVAAEYRGFSVNKYW